MFPVSKSSSRSDNREIRSSGGMTPQLVLNKPSPSATCSNVKHQTYQDRAMEKAIEGIRNMRNMLSYDGFENFYRFIKKVKNALGKYFQ